MLSESDIVVETSGCILFSSSANCSECCRSAVLSTISAVRRINEHSGNQWTDVRHASGKSDSVPIDL